MSRLLVLAVAAVLLLPARAAALGAAGEHDPTFASGAAYVPFDFDAARSRTSRPDALAAAPGGKWFVSGNVTNSFSTTVVRLAADGGVDPSFGPFVDSGWEAVDLWGTDAGGVGFGSPQRFDTGDDDVAGYHQGAARLTPAGAADPAYGSGGRAVYKRAGGEAASVAGVAPGPGGSVFTVGQHYEASGPDDAIVTKFDNLGNGRDAAFGSRIFNPATGTNADSGASAVAVDAQGRPVIAGYARANGDEQLFVTRLDGTTSSPDSTFGTTFAGTTRIPVHPLGAVPYVSVADVAVTGGIVTVAGTTKDAKDRYLVFVARFDAAGKPLTAFGPDGVRQFQIGTGETPYSSTAALGVQPDGAIVLVGQDFLGGSSATAFLARITADGRLDPGFGAGGVVRDRFASYTQATDLVVHGDRVTVLGRSFSGSESQGYLAQYLLAPLPDPVTGGSGGAAPGGGGGSAAPPAGSPPTAVAGKASVGKRTFAVDRRGRVAIGVSCPATGPCAGRIDLVASSGAIASAKRRPRRAVRYGRKAYALRGGSRTTVRVTLSKAARRIVKRKGRLRARLVLTRIGAARATTRVTVKRKR